MLRFTNFGDHAKFSRRQENRMDSGQVAFLAKQFLSCCEETHKVW